MAENRFGSELGLIHEMLILGRKVGADRTFWKRLSQNEELLRRMVAMSKESAPSEKAVKPQSAELDTFKVIVDYAKPLAEMIMAGKYDNVDGDITPEHFPHDQTRTPEEVEIRLVHLNRPPTTCEALAQLDQMGLRSVNLPELLALGAAYPDLQRSMCIAAFVSGWRNTDGIVRGPMLYEACGMRYLFQIWGGPDYRWSDYHRFAAVPK